MATLGTRLDRLEASLSGPTVSTAEVELIRQKIAAKVPVWVQAAENGDDRSLRLLCRFRPDIEAGLVRMAGEGNEEAAELLERLNRARAEMNPH